MSFALATTGLACTADAGPDLKGTDDGAVPHADTSIAVTDTGESSDTTLSGRDTDGTDTALADGALDTTASDGGIDTSLSGDGGLDTTPFDGGTDTFIADGGIDTGDAGADVVGTDASCPSCPLELFYKTPSTAATSNDMKPWVNVTNLGSTAQPLTEITIRYWFTINGDHALINFCDYALLGCANITGAYTKLPTAKATADYYYEIGFTAGAGSIAPGGTTGEIQNRLHKSDYSNWTQTDDWSFDGTKTAYALWDHITVYRKGVLVYGTEPP